MCKSRQIFLFKAYIKSVSQDLLQITIFNIHACKISNALCAMYVSYIKIIYTYRLETNMKFMDKLSMSYGHINELSYRSLHVNIIYHNIFYMQCHFVCVIPLHDNERRHQYLKIL